jgi:thiamine biosynthesis lipoprotein
MEQIAFRAMGCQMLAVLDGADTAMHVLNQVPGWFEEWEQELSRFRPDSDLNRLNRSAGQPVRVTATLWRVLQLARWAARHSDGLVTPTVLPALLAAGYRVSFREDMCTQVEPWHVRLEHASADWRRISFNRRAHSVTLPPGLELDLGGVAKGWAAGEAVSRLRAYGPVLVDAGGDIAVSGPRTDGSPWPVGVANPASGEEPLALLALFQGGVATSGRDYRRWRQGDRWQHHIIDPRTGQPAATDVLTVTVVAASVPEAEVAAKVALMLGSRGGLAWLERRPSLAAMLVLEDGQVVQSSRFADYMWKE